MAITDWPEGERPREKLLQQGVAALSDAELLAIFLRVGVAGKSAVDLARDLLTRFGNLNGIFAASRESLSVTMVCVVRMLPTTHMKQCLSVLLGLFLGGLMVHPAKADSGITEYFGTCDASAAAAIGTNLFVVANDEDNILRAYQLDKIEEPVNALDLTDFLKIHGKYPETDIEGAAKVRDRVYWIGSHGANKDGKARFNRRRFFATDIKVTGDTVSIIPVGVPYENLVQDMAKLPTLKNEHLAAAAKIAPKEVGGLNIEGLAATPEGALLIGLRNPIPNGKALLIPLKNPDEVIAEKRQYSVHQSDFLLVVEAYAALSTYQYWVDI